MYSLWQIRRAIKNPIRFGIEANRLYYRRLYRRDFNSSGVDIFAEDWDNLILLDACRYDLFATRSTLTGSLSAQYSRGSSTVEFLKGNFSGRDLSDTVYVTANPQLYRYRDEIDTRLYDVINIWKEDGWDEEVGTVFPETTTKYAIQAAEDYPNKRLIIHYIQPHYPFVNSNTEFDKGHIDNPNDGEVFWYQIMENKIEVSREQIWEAYTENLDITLPHVESLIGKINGKTIVTSDHGNMIGERAFPIPIQIWGHPKGIYTEQLVKIPWLVNEDSQRRTIFGEEPQTRETDIDGKLVRDRLERLGYLE